MHGFGDCKANQAESSLDDRLLSAAHLINLPDRSGSAILFPRRISGMRKALYSSWIPHSLSCFYTHHSRSAAELPLVRSFAGRLRLDAVDSQLLHDRFTSLAGSNDESEPSVFQLDPHRSFPLEKNTRNVRIKETQLNTPGRSYSYQHIPCQHFQDSLRTGRSIRTADCHFILIKPYGSLRFERKRLSVF